MTDFLQVKNRAYSTLAADIDDDDTSLTVATGEGARFPSNFPFNITICLRTGATESNIEIVKCTNRSGDTLTIVRGQESTTPVAHSAGELIELRVTAAIIKQIQDHEALTTGVHGVGANYIAKSSVDGLNLASHNSRHEFDGADPVKIQVLCKAYLAVQQSDLLNTGNPRVMLDTVSIDIGSNFQLGDWYGADGAYRQSDADSDATHIEDDDANFPNAIAGSLVKWASNAAGTLNTGVGYVVASGIDSDTLTIYKTSGADFAASYYYWIKKGFFVAPVAGWYQANFQIYYGSCEADDRYGVYIFINGVQNIAALTTVSANTNVRLPHGGLIHCDANDVVTLHGYCSESANATIDYLAGEFNTLLSIYLVRAD